jgi:hypothetical protein
LKTTTYASLGAIFLHQLTEQALLSVAPKKPNWDLKRDVEPNLEYLDRQTQLSLMQLLSMSLLFPLG